MMGTHVWFGTNINLNYSVSPEVHVGLTLRGPSYSMMKEDP